MVDLHETDGINDGRILPVSEDGHKVMVKTFFSKGLISYHTAFGEIPYGYRMPLKEELIYMVDNLRIQYWDEGITLIDRSNGEAIELPFVGKGNVHTRDKSEEGECCYTWMWTDIEDPNMYLFRFEKDGGYTMVGKNVCASLICFKDIEDGTDGMGLEVTDDGATHMEDIPMVPGHFGGNKKDPKQVEIEGKSAFQKQSMR